MSPRRPATSYTEKELNELRESLFFNYLLVLLAQHRQTNINVFAPLPVDPSSTSQVSAVSEHIYGDDFAHARYVELSFAPSVAMADKPRYLFRLAVEDLLWIFFSDKKIKVERCLYFLPLFTLF